MIECFCIKVIVVDKPDRNYWTMEFKNVALTLICRWRWCTASYTMSSGSLWSRRSGCLSLRWKSVTKDVDKCVIQYKSGSNPTDEFLVRLNEEVQVFEASSVNHKGTQLRSGRKMALAEMEGWERRTHCWCYIQTSSSLSMQWSKLLFSS